jgi:hypothetical protein
MTFFDIIEGLADVSLILTSFSGAIRRASARIEKPIRLKSS